MKYEKIIKQMTVQEKANLCVGDGYWNTKAIERMQIPSIKMSDGPHGLRVQKTKADNLGINESEISTCFPSAATLANSWNKNLSYEMGKALGEEASYEGVDIVLGPAINIKRSPLCGRNFEYFSEDPYLTGIMGTQYVKGVQENGVGVCVKHFAVNNQENRRRTINAVVDERTLREIYLKAFEMIVKEASPLSIMSAYNKLNGQYCTENKELLNILKKEWQFKGIVITDWGAENDRVSGIIAGNELEMPGGRGNGAEEIAQAVENGKIKEEQLDELIDRLLDVIYTASKRKNLIKYDRDEHHNIALKIAEESIVLLKNDESILPLKTKQNEKIGIIGDMAITPRYQGAGSSTINPYKLENMYNCLKEQNVNFKFAKGYERIISNNDELLLKEAIEIAKNCKNVLLFVGLTENYEAEGMDRQTLDIPENQNRLIEEICKVNNNVIVVLANGAPIQMPWKNNVKAIITGYLGGEAGAKAMFNCIFGKINPSGKLAETYPIKVEDTPCYGNFPGTEISVEYQEGIYVGYRYYNKINKPVLFPFGFGLSYTTFNYSDLVVSKLGEDSKIKNNKDELLNSKNEISCQISFKVKNTGNIKGKEIVQIYIKQENPIIFKATKELKAFEKVELEVNEEKEIKMVLNIDAFTYYNIETKKWAVENGQYSILVGSSSDNILLKKSITIESTDSNISIKYPEVYITGNVQNTQDEEFEKLLGNAIPKRTISLEEITDENTLEQLKNTKIGKYIYENQIEKMNKLLEEQNVNKATKVMMDLQKPLKKFYEKKSGKYTKEMIEKLLKIAKNDVEYTKEECEFLKLYCNLDQSKN